MLENNYYKKMGFSSFTVLLKKGNTIGSAIKCVIFDLDGVLVENTEAVVQCFQETSRHLGKKIPSREEIKTQIGKTPKEIIIHFFPDIDADKTAHIFQEEYIRAIPKITLKPFALELLNLLKKKKTTCCLVSNNTKMVLTTVLKKTGIKDFFTAVIGLDDVRHGKPHPEGLLKAIELSGCIKKECFYIGDTEIDKKAGNNAKIETIIVKSHVSNTKIDIENLSEIIKRIGH